MTRKTKPMPFWKTVPLEELVEQQGVPPADDLDEIADLWPADDDPERLLQHVLADRAARRKLQQEVE